MSFLNRFRSPEKIAAIEANKKAELAVLQKEMDAADWRYYYIPNEMTGKTRLIGCLVSTNTHELAFPYHGGSGLTITVCRHPRQVRVVIDNGQFLYDIESGLVEPRFVSRISVKIGNGGIFTMVGSQSKSMESNEIILDNPSLLIMRMKQQDTMVIEPRLYGEGQRVFRFKPRGMSNALY